MSCFPKKSILCTEIGTLRSVHFMYFYSINVYILCIFQPIYMYKSQGGMVEASNGGGEEFISYAISATYKHLRFVKGTH